MKNVHLELGCCLGWVSDASTSAVHTLIFFLAEDEGVPVVLVCGPKNTGKSTFNRYLINLLLNR